VSIARSKLHSNSRSIWTNHSLLLSRFTFWCVDSLFYHFVPCRGGSLRGILASGWRASLAGFWQTPPSWAPHFLRRHRRLVRSTTGAETPASRELRRGPTVGCCRWVRISRWIRSTVISSVAAACDANSCEALLNEMDLRDALGAQHLRPHARASNRRAPSTGCSPPTN